MCSPSVANIAWLRRGRSEGSGNSHVKIGTSWNASASTAAIGPTSSTVATLSSSVIASPSDRPRSTGRSSTAARSGGIVGRPTRDGAVMDVSALFEDLLSRVHEHVHGIPEGLTPEDLIAVPEPDANPIGWLLWHVTRVQDAYTSELTECEQVWMVGDWASRFGLTAEPNDVGYGHTPEQVRAVRPESAAAIFEYYDAV